MAPASKAADPKPVANNQNKPVPKGVFVVVTPPVAQQIRKMEVTEPNIRYRDHKLDLVHPFFLRHVNCPPYSISGQIS